MNDVVKFLPKAPLGKVGDASHLANIAIKYRRRASQLGQEADAEPSEQQMLILLHQALSWIQLAENEEMLSRANTCTQVLVRQELDPGGPIRQ